MPNEPLPMVLRTSSESQPRAAACTRAIRSTIASCVTIAAVSSSLAACAVMPRQSTPAPSEIEDATLSKVPLSSAGAPTGHLLCESDEGTADGHVGGRDARLTEHDRQVGVGEAELDAADDGLAILLAQALHRRLVGVDG